MAPHFDASHARKLGLAVEHLATHDPEHEAFGARSHRYQFTRPLTPARRRAIERKLGVDLPDEYATFLSTNGSGAGPYEGLLPLDARSQLELLDGDFPARKAWNEPGDPAFEMPTATRGTIALGHLGCTYWALLVVRGPARGQVWLDLRSANAGFVPAYRSFRAYYDKWLAALVDGKTVALPLDPKACGLPHALDQAIARFARDRGRTAARLSHHEVARALAAIPDGAIALRASNDRFFDDGDPVNPCPSCASTLGTLLASGAMRPAQVLRGVAPLPSRVGATKTSGR